MLKFVDTDHFLDQMREVEEYARGFRGLGIDYASYSPPEASVGRDFACERFLVVMRLGWYENILNASMKRFGAKDRIMWWSLRALRLSRRESSEIFGSWSSSYLHTSKAKRTLDAMDQSLLDVLSQRNLLTYIRITDDKSKQKDPKTQAKAKKLKES